MQQNYYRWLRSNHRNLKLFNKLFNKYSKKIYLILKSVQCNNGTLRHKTSKYSDRAFISHTSCLITHLVINDIIFVGKYEEQISSFRSYSNACPQYGEGYNNLEKEIKKFFGKLSIPWLRKLPIEGRTLAAEFFSDHSWLLLSLLSGLLARVRRDYRATDNRELRVEESFAQADMHISTLQHFLAFPPSNSLPKYIQISEMGTAASTNNSTAGEAIDLDRIEEVNSRTFVYQTDNG